LTKQGSLVLYNPETRQDALESYKKNPYLLILEGSGEALKIAKEQAKNAINVIETLTRSQLLSQGYEKKEIEQKINELKQLLERNPEEASKFVLSWVQK
jgi:hypothetical protein